MTLKPLVESLSKSARIKLRESYLRQLSRTALSASEIQRRLSEAGLGMRRQVLLQRVKEIRSIIARGISLSDYAPYEQLSRQYLAATEMQLSKNYLYEFQAHVDLPVSGLSRIYQFRFGSNDMLTRAQIESEIQRIADRISQSYKEKRADVSDVTFRQIYYQSPTVEEFV
jgi:hypothetical protein